MPVASPLGKLIASVITPSLTPYRPSLVGRYYFDDSRFSEIDMFFNVMALRINHSLHVCCKRTVWRFSGITVWDRGSGLYRFGDATAPFVIDGLVVESWGSGQSIDGGCYSSMFYSVC